MYLPIAKDKQGRPWALCDDVDEGDILIADNGFTCMCKDVEHEVFTGYENTGKYLYIKCDDGEHNLDGQYEEWDLDIPVDIPVQPFYVGLYKKGI